MQRVEGVEPTVVTFNAVMSATVKSGRWQEAGKTALTSFSTSVLSRTCACYKLTNQLPHRKSKGEQRQHYD
eukprot:4291685-Pyramimonas_sp.AAC.1